MRKKVLSLSSEHRALFDHLLQEQGVAVPTRDSITRLDLSKPLALSFVQERLWFVQQLTANQSSYNMPLLIRLEGPLQPVVLERSLAELVRRHAVLRTVMQMIDGAPYQRVLPELVLPLPMIDASDWDAAQLDRWLRDQAQQPFDLEQGPLIRATLLRHTDHNHQLLLNVHHIICDGVSLHVLLHDLTTQYQALRSNDQATLPELPIQYADFAQWQRDTLRGEYLAGLLDYWTRQLRGLPARLELPTDRPTPPTRSGRGAMATLTLDPAFTADVQHLAQQESATPFMVLLATFTVMLGRYCGRNDIPVGVPVAGRERPELNQLIGCFINMLVLRTDLAENPPFRTLLRDVRAQALEAYARQSLPFEQLVDALKLPRDLSHHPLFQVAFSFQESAPQVRDAGDLCWSMTTVDLGAAKFDLELHIEQTSAGYRLCLVYSTDLFDGSTATRMLDHLQTLLQGVIADPDQRVASLPLLSDADRYQQLVAWNTPDVLAPAIGCLHQGFEAQAAANPDHVAVVCGDQRLTYGELNRRANQLGRYLQRQGVTLESRVGLCIDRSPALLVGLLGILKAGAAYVSLDSTYPAARLALMLEDAQISLLLTEQHLLDYLPQPAHQQRYVGQVVAEDQAPAPLSSPWRMVCIDRDWPAIAAEPEENLLTLVDPENLAYVLYTSGSTGRPKGVCSNHAGVVNLLADVALRQSLSPSDRGCLWTTINFDVSIYEIFSALLAGAELYIVPQEQRADSRAYAEWLQTNGITSAYIPPFALADIAQWLRSGQGSLSLRRLLVGVEPIPEQVLVEIGTAIKDVKIINGYGPTEASIFSLMHEVQLAQAVDRRTPIGRPPHNMRVYLLDQHMQLVPVGVAGEVYISGVGLARGYLNRPDLTAARFVPNPFAGSSSPEPSSGSQAAGNGQPASAPVDLTRLYKTGDLARYLPDGAIEFIGRSDHQIKLRGFRIELGEIESVLGQHAAVRESCVVVHQTAAGDSRLLAYVVLRSNTTGSDLRAWLQNSLPAYMVPSAVIPIAELPLLPNGKIDRQTLAQQAQLHTPSRLTAPPQTVHEQRIATIWSALLGIEQIGIHDNFFDLGGHSLLLPKLQQELQVAFGQPIVVVDLFRYPTISLMAHYLTQPTTPRAPRTAAQERGQRQRVNVRRIKQ